MPDNLDSPHNFESLRSSDDPERPETVGPPTEPVEPITVPDDGPESAPVSPSPEPPPGPSESA